MRRLIPLLAFYLLALPPSCGAGVAPAATSDSTWIAIPEFGRLCGTWLWAETDGVIGVSTPQLSGTRRTLILRPDLTYELHQRRAAQDTTLCQGHYTVSEQESREGDRTLTIAFADWYQQYEQIMLVEFESPDTVRLAGYPCADCPSHVYVRGQSKTIEGEVRRGKRFRAHLWNGRSFELSPVDSCWEIAVRDTVRPSENLARLTPQLRVDAAASQRTMDFIFSPEVGRSETGWGTLAIRDTVLRAAAPGRKPTIVTLRFSVNVEEASGAAP